jgi:hypothetical protein
MHQGILAFNKTLLLKLLHDLIFKSPNESLSTVHNHHIQAYNKNK